MYWYYFSVINLLCLYEYNYTYSGTKKSYEFDKTSTDKNSTVKVV